MILKVICQILNAIVMGGALHFFLSVVSLPEDSSLRYEYRGAATAAMLVFSAGFLNTICLMEKKDK